MSTIYVVGATGGFGEPSFVSTTDLAEAETQYTEWTKVLLEEPGERVDLLEIVLNEDGTTKTSLLRTEWV